MRAFLAADSAKLAKIVQASDARRGLVAGPARYCDAAPPRKISVPFQQAFRCRRERGNDWKLP
jgi:hypothetical protein